MLLCLLLWSPLLIELPVMSETELAEAIQFEAHRFIPSSLDDVSLSWQWLVREAKERSRSWKC